MKKLSLVIGILFLSACASSGKRAPTAIAQTESFIKSVEASAVSDWKSEPCTDKKTENRQWKDLVKEANGCVAKEKWSRVSLLGEELAKRDVSSPWGPFYISLAAERMEDLERSSWMIETAIKRAPNLGMLHYQKSRILWKKGQFTGSIESARQALRLDTNLIDAHLFVGQVLFRDQDFGRAAQHFQSVLRVRPKDPTALLGLAECHIQMTDAKGALEILKKGQRHFPSETVFLLREAYIYEVVLNEVDKAISLYREVEKGLLEGRLTGQPDFSLSQKIQKLEVSVQGRALARSSEEIRQ